MKKEAWIGIGFMALTVIGVFWMMPPPSQWTNGHLGLLMLAMIVIGIMMGFPTAFIIAWMIGRSKNSSLTKSSARIKTFTALDPIS